MNIDEMQAGVEMDLLIATEVMGWKPHPDPLRCLNVVTQEGHRTCHPGGDGEVTFCPSTDIAHAWEVVEHMTQTTKEDWELRVTTTLHVAIFEFEGGRDRPWKPGQYVGQGLTMPLAICRAALKAVR